MDETFLNELKKIIGEDRIFENESMARHTTFRCGGPARLLITPKRESVADVVKLCRQFSMETFIIGNGSNLLVRDGGFPGVVIELKNQLSDISVSGDEIVAEAGATLASVSMSALSNELEGLEFASGIPGCVGGALTMNAGAYGGEMSMVVKEATLLTQEGDIITLRKDELELSYRHSIIPEKGYIVLSVTFALKKGDKTEIRSMMDDFNQRRRDKQPLEYPSAGSTFKRPSGFFAGKLIEDAGLKGYRVGGAEVSTKHAGFVINKENATSRDIIKLMDDVSEKVFKEFGVRLEPEVKVIGVD